MAQENQDWRTALRKTVSRWEVHLPEEEMDFFGVYLDELIQWNKKVNLTALKEPLHIALGHFADSLAPMIIDGVFKARHARAIDIGTGAGLPGLPLKIVNPDWQVSLVESTGKKCAFLRAIVAAMELSKVEIYNERCEDMGHHKDHRERYDLAFARALSSLSTLIEYGLPFLRVGGLFVAHRGRTAADEATRVNVALEELGGEVKQIHHYEIGDLGGSRNLVVIEKIRPSSRHYPRRTGVAAKRPL